MTQYFTIHGRTINRKHEDTVSFAMSLSSCCEPLQTQKQNTSGFIETFLTAGFNSTGDNSSKQQISFLHPYNLWLSLAIDGVDVPKAAQLELNDSGCSRGSR